MMKDTVQKIGQPNDFYVYAWIRPDTGDVFYVGKGRGIRDTKIHGRNEHFTRIVNKLKSLGLKPIVTRVAEGLREQEAFDLEIKLIASYGRVKDGGTLCNMTIGGDGAAGVVHTDASKARRSESIKITLSDPAVKAKMREVQIRRYENPAEREKTSAAVRVRYQDPKEREKMAQPLRGVKKAKNHVENVRRALVETWNHNSNLKESHRRLTLNRPPSKANKSGYKGVSFDKSSGKWLAQIEVGGRNKHLGRHPTAEEAAKAYDDGVQNFYGNDVYLNFPPDKAAA